MSEEEEMDLNAVQKELGFTRPYLMRLIKAGKLQATKKLADVGGSKLYVTREEIERFRKARDEEALEPKKPGRPPWKEKG